MAGFPTRPSLDAFGPEMVNKARVLDPRKELDAAVLNLHRWQLAGLGQTSPQAWALVTFTSPSTVTVTAHANVWRGAAPVIARTGTGVYTLTWPALAANEKGDLVPVQFFGATPSPRGATLRASWDITGGRIVTVSLFDKADAAADGSFFVAVF